MSLGLIGRVLIVVTLSGCTSMQFQDFFSGYAQQMSKARQAELQGDFNGALKLTGTKSKSHNNYALSQLERGRLFYLLQDWEASQKEFALAFDAIEKSNEKAKLQLSRGLQKTGAVISNDSAIEYQVPYYEQGMLHSFQALNYLYQGQVEGALVEIRRAALVQENALKENESKVFDAEESFNKNSLNRSYPNMGALIGEVKNGFQNAYTFYLSGVLYEVSGELNDAYIDYKKALEIVPNNQYIQQDVIRLAKVLGMSADIEQLSTQQLDEYQSKESSSTGVVLVIAEQGLIRAKQEFSANLPIFTRHNDARFFSFSLPVYKGNLSSLPSVMLSYENTSRVAEPIVRLESLAAKNLEEELPSMVARQTIRVIAKEQMRRKMSKEGGDVGNILAGLYNIATEHADTRGWVTLPDGYQIVKMVIPAGKQQVKVTMQGQSTDINITVNENRITLINVTAVGRFQSYKTTTL